MKTHLFLIPACLAFASAASAQVIEICSESFDYPFPALLDAQNGGSGWSGPWTTPPNSTDVVIQANPPINPTNPFPWPEADGVGNYAQQAFDFGQAARFPDRTGHDDVVENGLFGKDGSTIWVSFTIWNFQQNGIHFGSLSFYGGGLERWLIGSPWASYKWGIDSCPGFGCFYTVPGTNDAVSARLVTRIDYQAGQDRVRLWIDPAEPYPDSNPALDQMITDHRWDEIRLWCGGSGSLYYWDDVVIEKGHPNPPIAYCFGDGSGTPCPCGNNGGTGEGCRNSTGSGAVVSAAGTSSVSDDDLSFAASNLLPGQSALLFVGNNAVNNGNGSFFGDGLRCAGGNVVRLGIETPDAAGDASWGPGLSAMGGWSAGDTKRFQVWCRDPSGSPCATGFNLSNGIEVVFTI